MSLDLTRQSLLKTILYFVLLAVIFWGAELFQPERSGLVAAAHDTQMLTPPAGTPLGALLDQQGVAIRTGHHCAQPLIDMLGIPGTARLSFAIYTTQQEIDSFITALRKAITILQ